MHGHKDNNANRSVNRAQSTLSVSAVDYYLSSPNPPSPAMSTITLTPGRVRNIDQDMEALKMSRQDNPFIRQVIASRESLDCLDESESDDTNLMAQEFPAECGEVDPLSLPEVHEHMIRSPPPVDWPKSPSHRFFQFPSPDDETLQVEVESKEKSGKSNRHQTQQSNFTNCNNWDGDGSSPFKFGAHAATKSYQERFALLAPNVLRSGEDSIRLMSTDD